jgi:hypothetical protein
LRLRPRHKRYALLAATVALAAAFGAAVGLKAGGGAATPAHHASLAETHVMQHTIGKLGKEIAALKARVAAADKATHNEIARLDAKTAAQLRNEAAPDITGSIAAPATVPTPLPRPAVTAQQRPLVRNWSIRSVRDGDIFVEGHGEIFLVQVGAPLPGLGRVQAVRREHGRWLVVTPKGLIVSLSDRHYFE